MSEHDAMCADAAKVISRFEGFLPRAQWDVNAYRLGYGSDTEGPDQIPVGKHSTTTRERALANLQKRIPEFESVAIRQVGRASWDRLPRQAKTGLLSFIYNYGHLTESLRLAISRNLPLAQIALAVEARAGDNGSINAKRRFQEARLIRQA